MLKKNLIQVFIPLAAVAALAMALPVLPALAAPRGTTLQTIQGKVTTPPIGTNITIQKADNTIATISVDQTTKYYLISTGQVRNYVNNQVNKDLRQDNNQQSRAGAMKSLHIPANWRDNLGWLDTFNKAASFSDVALGDRVIARIDPNNGNIATQVLIVKAPVIQQVRGTVIISGNQVNVTPTSGNTFLLTWDTNTRFTIKGMTSIPLGVAQNGVAVTYNSTTKFALLVNFAPVANP